MSDSIESDGYQRAMLKASLISFNDLDKPSRVLCHPEATAEGTKRVAGAGNRIKHSIYQHRE